MTGKAKQQAITEDSFDKIFKGQWKEVMQRTTQKANELLKAKHPDITIHEWETGFILLAFLNEFKDIK